MPPGWPRVPDDELLQQKEQQTKNQAQQMNSKTSVCQTPARAHVSPQRHDRLVNIAPLATAEDGMEDMMEDLSEVCLQRLTRPSADRPRWHTAM